LVRSLEGLDDTEQLKNRICIQNISTDSNTEFIINISNGHNKQPFVIICINGMPQLYIVSSEGFFAKIYTTEGVYGDVIATKLNDLQIKISGSALIWNNIIVFSKYNFALSI
jgi:hypothetical protein